MMGHKEKMIDGDECDGLTPWKPGERKRIKHKFNRRIRKKWRYGLH